MKKTGILLTKLKKSYEENVVLDIEEAFLEAGNVYGLVGTNGVGKTTLLNLIEGSLKPDQGTVDTGELRVEMVHHESGLFNELTVYENMFIGRERIKNRAGIHLIDWKKVMKEAKDILKRYDLDLDIKARVSQLDFSTQKLLELIMALSRNPDVLLVDEPIAFMDIQQVDYLNELIGTFMKTPGKIVIYSSHRFDELFSVVDKVITMRERKIVSISDATSSVIDGLLDFSEKGVHKYPKRPVRLGRPILEVDHLKAEHLEDVSFKLHQGEILGIVGLRGAYKSHIGKAIFGAIPFDGKIRIDGSDKRIRSTYHAVESGICYLGNQDEGVFINDSIVDNVVSANVPRVRRLSRGAKRLISKYYLEQLNIRFESENQSMQSMSTGNKQKILLAKWFFSKSKIFIFNKPTSNIDAVSKVDIYNIFADLVSSGAGILMISNDLEEIAGMCDRVLVIEAGRIKTEILRDKLSVHRLVEALQNW